MTTTLKPLLWHNCYDASWKGVITAASFAHPAKFSRGLIDRIYQHCLERGYLQKGDTVGDPFGGVGTGGIIAGYNGLNWVGVELEERFVKMADDNFKLHQASLMHMHLPIPRIMQGDSRKFDVLVGPDYEAMITSPPYGNSSGQIGALKAGSCDGVIASPPYSDIAAGAGGLNTKPAKHPGQQSGRNPDSASQSGNWSKELLRYGKADGQISRLKSGQVDAVIASPPYAGTSDQGGGGGINVNGYTPAPGRKWTGAAPDPVGQRTYQGRAANRSKDNIETLKEGTVEAVVSSPPWEDEVAGGCPGSRLKAPPTSGKGHSASLGARERQAQRDEQRVYGESPGQIGKLSGGKLDAICSSPPYEATDRNSLRKNKSLERKAELLKAAGHDPAKWLGQRRCTEMRSNGYGESMGQIGETKGETYWQAMHLVYRACFRAIKPNGVIVLVVKDYVSQKKRVPLCDDTIRLLEHIGFTVIERIHAMLVNETKHNDFFAGETVTKKERKSFFRRLAEKKGSPPIDFEEVIIARKIS